MIVDEESLRNKIYVIRNQQVMLDFDLAEIYGYQTSKLNEQVRNNAERFEGEDFMFQLTKEEFENLMSKNRISSWGGRRKLPHAFTESGLFVDDCVAGRFGNSAKQNPCTPFQEYEGLHH